MPFSALQKYESGWREIHAWWEHSGNPNDPHVILSGGDHSGLFMNNGRIAQKRPWVYQAMMRDLIAHARTPVLPDFVVAPAVGGIQMAYAIALAYKEIYDHECEQYFTDKVTDENGDVTGMTFKRGAPTRGMRGIVYDDVTTTLAAIQHCANATIECGAELIAAGTTLNRSPYTSVSLSNGQKLPLHALVRKHVQNMPAEQCSLCAQGSRAFRPKELWDELVHA